MALNSAILFFDDLSMVYPHSTQDARTLSSPRGITTALLEHLGRAIKTGSAYVGLLIVNLCSRPSSNRILLIVPSVHNVKLRGADAWGIMAKPPRVYASQPAQRANFIFCYTQLNSKNCFLVAKRAGFFLESRKITAKLHLSQQ